MAKFRLKFTSKVVPDNTGYFVRKRKVGFTACPLQHPEMAKILTQEKLDDVMQFMREQDEFNYYDFEIEEIAE